jgi:ABC-type amino acid transport substrate-binding protein
MIIQTVINKLVKIFIFFTFIGCAYCDDEMRFSYSLDIQKIMDRGYLIVAMFEGERVPFFNAAEDNKEPLGLDVDFAKEIATNLGIGKVVFNRKAKDFTEVVNIVARNEADIGISKLSFTYDRGKKVRYSSPYTTLSKALFINRVVFPQIFTLSDEEIQPFFNKPQMSIGVIGGTSYVGFAKSSFPKAQIIPMKTWGEVIRALEKKEISAAFWDDFEIEKYIHLHPEKFLTLKMLKLKHKDTIHMILPANSIQFSNFIELFIETNEINYVTPDILDKYKKIIKDK